ncbi:ComF family protein [Dolosigranulum pigrum]
MTDTCLHCGTELTMRPTLIRIFLLKKPAKIMLCSACLNQFAPLLTTHNCPGCWRQMTEAGYCSDCQGWLQHFPKQIVNHRALYAYNDFAREWMHTFKRLGDVRYGQVFREPLQQLITDHFPNATLVPIPSSQSSLTKRGFNQIHVMLDTLNQPYEALLEHVGSGPNQASKTRQERLSSKQPFQVREARRSSLPPAVLLIDDVYTTGRTIYHAKEALLNAGINNIGSLSIFR